MSHSNSVGPATTSNPVPTSRPPARPIDDVVVLRESEVEDLAAAIQRLRANPTTRNSRILVVGKEPEAVEPQAGPTIRPLAPAAEALALRRAEQQTLQRVGARFERLTAYLNRFLEEAGWALDQGKGPETLRRVSDILGWIEAIAQELTSESKAALEGREELDTVELLREAAAQLERRCPGIRVGVTSDGVPARTLGRSADLAEAFFLALGLIAQRLGGLGFIAVSVEATSRGLEHIIRGRGQAGGAGSGAAIDRFRRLVLEEHGGCILPLEDDPAGLGLTIVLPAPTPQPPG